MRLILRSPPQMALTITYKENITDIAARLAINRRWHTSKTAGQRRLDYSLFGDDLIYGLMGDDTIYAK